MEENKEREIQKKLEDNENLYAGLNAEEQAAAESYQQLFRLLENEPVKGFSVRFSQNIIQKIQAKQDRRFAYWTYILTALIILPGMLFITLFLGDNFNPVVASIAQYKWVIIFGIVLVFAMQFFDRKPIPGLSK